MLTLTFTLIWERFMDAMQYGFGDATWFGLFILGLIGYAGYKKGLPLSSMLVVFTIVIPILRLMDLLPALFFDLWILGVGLYLAWYLVRWVS